MEDSIYIALSGQVATQRRLDVLSNNIANVNTPGFKAEKPMFLEYIEKLENQPLRDRNQRRISMVSDYGVYTDFKQGAFEQTGSPLDLALNGDGFFVVDMGGGKHAYTRNGSFQIDAQRQLVTSAGQPVLDSNNNPIVIPNGDAQIRVNDDGTVSTETGVVGQLQVAKFEREQFMTPLGSSLHSTDEQPQPANGTQIKQGMLESSNVNAIEGITNLIEVNRAYSMANSTVSEEHDRINRAIRKLSGTS